LRCCEAVDSAENERECGEEAEKDCKGKLTLHVSCDVFGTKVRKLTAVYRLRKPTIGSAMSMCKGRNKVTVSRNLIAAAPAGPT